MIDLDRAEAEIGAATESLCRDRPGFAPMGTWRRRVARKIAAEAAAE